MVLARVILGFYRIVSLPGQKRPKLSPLFPAPLQFVAIVFCLLRVAGSVDAALVRQDCLHTRLHIRTGAWPRR